MAEGGWTWHDAWILRSVGTGRGVRLAGVLAAADRVNKDTPSERSVGESLGRLVAGGLVECVDGRYRRSEAGQRVVGRGGSTEEVLDRLGDVALVPGSWRLAEGEYENAMVERFRRAAPSRWSGLFSGWRRQDLLPEVRLARLMSSLGALEALLARHGETRWSAWARDRQLEIAKNNDASRIPSAFGGMGSLNDLVIAPANGHTIQDRNVAAVNEELSRLRALIYDDGVGWRSTAP